MVVWALASQAQGIYNNNARIVSTSGSYWVVDNGDFALTSASATNLAQFANLTITDAASLTLGSAATPAYLTVSGTLANNSGDDGLVIPSGSSLIESSGTTAVVTFNIAAGEWHLIAVPASNATSGIFYGHYLQKHTEATNAYADVTDPGEVLAPMKGYAVWGDLADNQITYVGPVNKGEQTFALTHAGAGWNLIGNPYPSSIDWSLAYAANSERVNAATYRHVNASNWASYASGIQTNTATKYIAPGQGFFVTANAGGTINFSNTMRVHDAATFYKSSDEAVPNLIRLEVSGNGYKDEAVVRFLPEATAEFDGDYDAHKLYGDVAEAAQIYSTGSTPLAINSLSETDMVPVGVKAGVSGTFTITATEINNLQYASLEDTKTGIFTELANKAYTFNIDKGENELRFKLHFSMLGVSDNKNVAANIYSYQKTAYINLNSQLKGDIYIYNTAGQLVASEKSASRLTGIGLNATGLYIVKVVTGKATLTQKLIIR